MILKNYLLPLIFLGGISISVNTIAFDDFLQQEIWFCEECIKFERPKPPPIVIQQQVVPQPPKIPSITQQDIKIHKPDKGHYYPEKKKSGIFNDALVRREFVDGMIINCNDVECDQPDLHCKPNDKNVN